MKNRRYVSRPNSPAGVDETVFNRVDDLRELSHFLSNTTFPPTTVSSTFVSAILSLSPAVKMSRESNTKYCVFARSNQCARSFSCKPHAKALRRCRRRTASSTVMHCSANQPFRCLPSSVRRLTAASIPASGSSGATGQSEPNASTAPGVQQRPVRIRTRAATNAARRPTPVINHVIRLHGNNYAQFLEPLVVFRSEVLNVFNSEPTILRAVLLRDIGEQVSSTAFA